MLEDIMTSVIQSIIDGANSISALEDATGFTESEMVRPLKMLLEIGIVVESQKKYVLVKKLKAIQVARLAQLGLDINVFDTYFSVDKKEKKLALDIAGQSEKISQLDVSKRKPLIQKRAYLGISKTDDITENLFLMYETTNHMLVEHIEKINDPYLKMILDLHQQAEQALQNHLKK